MKKILMIVFCILLAIVPSVYALRTDLTLASDVKASVGFDYSTRSVAVGETFTLQIMVNNVNGMYGWQWWLNYDNTLLQCVNAVEGPFLKQGGWTFAGVGYCSTYANGYATLCGMRPGVSGSGCISIVVFKAVASGTVMLHLTKVKLVGLNLDSWPPIVTLPSIIYDCTMTLV